jgi:hypothetical protein
MSAPSLLDGPAVVQAIQPNSSASSRSSAAVPLLQNLTNQANSILSAVLQAPLQPLNCGSQGQFPYYYQNSANLPFNHLTYNWINSSLVSGAEPAQLDSALFSNQFISALAKVSYSLSKADQAQLVAAQKNASNQQVALLNAWVQAYGSLPPAPTGMMPIDVIISTIATKWAVPATTLTAMQASANLNALLNNIPASGQPIRPVLADWLNAIGSSISLQNAVTMNNAYLAQALSAVQNPKVGNEPNGNGGFAADDNNIYPAYTISPDPSAIINSLSDPSANQISITMSVSRASQSEYQVSIHGGGSFTIPILDFFQLSCSGSASYFQDQIAASSNQVSIEMTFSGCNLVNFGPAPFNMSTGNFWAFFSPIREAIQNGSRDVSGFKFASDPGIDFSTNGPFGFVNGVAIANYPTITINITSSDYQSILTTFQQTTSTEVTFLGIPLASTTESSYSSQASQSGSFETISITLSPPQSLVAGNINSSVGWVLGAELTYPCAQ